MTFALIAPLLDQILTGILTERSAPCLLKAIRSQERSFGEAALRVRVALETETSVVFLWLGHLAD